jgi:hypothetical protein
VTLRRQALGLRRRLSGEEDPKTLNAVWELGFALHRAGDFRPGDSLLNAWAAAIAQQPRELTPRRAQQVTEAGNIFMYRGRRDAAEPMFREALAIRRELYGDRHPLVASSMIDLAWLVDQERPRRSGEADSLSVQAVELLRATYPHGHPQLASALRMRGIVLEHQRRFEEAQAPLREALAIRRRLVGPNTIDVAMSDLDLAYALTMSGSYDEAASLAHEAIRVFRAQLGDKNSMGYFAQAHLGDALRGQGRYDEAEPLLVAAYARFARPNPVTKQWRGYVLAALVRLYEAQGRPDEAAKYRAMLDSAGRS